jgi:hypothetical protein
VAQTLFSIYPIALTLLSTVAVPATYRLPGDYGCSGRRTAASDQGGDPAAMGRDDLCLHDSAAVQSECANLRKSIFSTPAKLSCIFFYSTPSIRNAVNEGRAFGM